MSSHKINIIHNAKGKHPAASDPAAYCTDLRFYSPVKGRQKKVYARGGKNQGRPDKGQPSACRKSLAEFAPAGANRVSFIFSGGVYVGENTSRLANVRAQRVRCGEPQPFQTRAQRSGSRLRACQKSFFDKLKDRPGKGRPLRIGLFPDHFLQAVSSSV